MIWIILGGAVIFIFYKFVVAYNKDNQDLQRESVAEKFSVIVANINDAAFGGEGEVTEFDKRSFSLYKEGENQIINFVYATGSLTIKWQYKYFQKEVVHEKRINNVRNLSIFEQQKIARGMILEMSKIVERHKNSVLPSPSPMNSFEEAMAFVRENKMLKAIDLLRKVIREVPNHKGALFMLISVLLDEEMFDEARRYLELLNIGIRKGRIEISSEEEAILEDLRYGCGIKNDTNSSFSTIDVSSDSQRTFHFKGFNFSFDFDIPAQVIKLELTNGSTQMIEKPFGYFMGDIYLVDAKQTISDLVKPYNYESIFFYDRPGTLTIWASGKIEISGWSSESFINHQIVSEVAKRKNLSGK